MHLATQHRGARRHLLGHSLHLVVAVLDATENLVGLFLHADEHANELHPFGLPQRIEFLVSQVRHKCDACIFDGVVSTPFEGRDEDDVGVGGNDDLGIEVALHANLRNAPVLHTLFDVFIEKVLGACDALHHVEGIHHNEVGELRGGHANGALDGHFHFHVFLGHSRSVGTFRKKCKMVRPFHLLAFAHLTLTLALLRVADVDEAYAITRVGHGKSFGKLGLNDKCRVCGIGVVACLSCVAGFFVVAGHENCHDS